MFSQDASHRLVMLQAPSTMQTRTFIERTNQRLDSWINSTPWQASACLVCNAGAASGQATAGGEKNNDVDQLPTFAHRDFDRG